MACVRLWPCNAAHPEPGSRLLQSAVTSRKYVHRVRCMMLPPMVAMFRNCADALSSSASETTGYSVRTLGWAAASDMDTRAPTVSYTHL